jgi:hypothetical protein
MPTGSGYYITIGSGNLTNVNNIRGLESSLPELAYGACEFHLRSPLPASVISSLTSQLEAKGVALDGQITQRAGGSTILSIPFQKRMAPLVIILLIVLAVIAAILISWAVLKWISTSPAAQTALTAITGILLLGGIIALILVVKRNR